MNSRSRCNFRRSLLSLQYLAVKNCLVEVRERRRANVADEYLASVCERAYEGWGFWIYRAR